MFTNTRLAPALTGLFVAFTITACGGGGSGLNSSSPNACTASFNPAPVLVRGLENFVVQDALNKTWFYDFFTGLQPDPAALGNPADAQAAADQVGELSRAFIHFAGDYRNFTSIRNPLDLTESLIASDAVTDFITARTHISGCLSQGETAQWRNPSVTLIDASALDTDPLNDKQWSFLIDYRAVPVQNTVTRVISSANTGATVSTSYDGNSFATSGRNQPKLATLGFNSGSTLETARSLTLDKAFIDSKIDIWRLSDEMLFDFHGNQVNCVRVLLDYPMNAATVYWDVGMQDPEVDDKPTFRTTCFEKIADRIAANEAPNLSWQTDPAAAPERK